ncbi:unnamed protein product [Mucor circinelloides]
MVQIVLLKRIRTWRLNFVKRYTQARALSIFVFDQKKKTSSTMIFLLISFSLLILSFSFYFIVPNNPHTHRMSLSFITAAAAAAAAENWSHIKEYVCQARGKNYCLIHKRYFEISWCPECGRMS